MILGSAVISDVFMARSRGRIIILDRPIADMASDLSGKRAVVCGPDGKQSVYDIAGCDTDKSIDCVILKTFDVIQAGSEVRIE